MTMIALMMKAATTSESSMNFYQTTWRNILEDSHLHLHGRLFSLRFPRLHFNVYLQVSVVSRVESYPMLRKTMQCSSINTQANLHA